VIPSRTRDGITVFVIPSQIYVIPSRKFPLETYLNKIKQAAT